MKDEQTKTIDTIRACARDIEALETNIKAAREMVNEIIEADSAYADVEECKAELANAQAKLKESLMRNGKYNDLMEKIANLNENMKDDKEVLSNALIVYYKETGERQFEVNDHIAREVLLTGKLGKEQRYQPSLFSSNRSYEISDGNTTLVIDGK